jgi:hypothetical protein
MRVIREKFKFPWCGNVIAQDAVALMDPRAMVNFFNQLRLLSSKVKSGRKQFGNFRL